MMKIYIIAAMSQNRIIGKGNKLPWRLPADMRRFRQLTICHPVIMGRKTLESIGHSLRDRFNIVLTRQPFYNKADCHIAPSLDEALELAGIFSDEVFIIGGAEIFRQALPRADRLYLTIINQNFDGDTFFPEFDDSQWKEVERIAGERNDRNPYDFYFATLERK